MIERNQTATSDMTGFPTFSIITPTLNAAATIEEVLDSVSRQSYQRIEHVVVDGGSTDKTSEIVGHYMGQTGHIRFHQGKDKGLYDALNKGILASSGDYLIFLGSDDVFHDQEVLSDVVKTEALDGRNVVYGNVLISGDTGWAHDGDFYDGLFTTAKLMRKNICHQAIFYPHNIFSQLGFYDIRYPINADWDMNMRCWAKESFFFVDRVISTFHAGGCSTNAVDEAFKNDYLKKIQSYFNLNPEELLRCAKESPWGELSWEGISPRPTDSLRKIIRSSARLFVSKFFKHGIRS